jgi:AP-3 complex subunit beta
VTNSKARASIIWVVGEYVDTIKEYAPDILRQLAKDFPNETDAAKVQILNLAAKLMFTNPEQSALIAQYIFHMAKFDLNYDIRDKARLMRFMLFPDPVSIFFLMI